MTLSVGEASIAGLAEEGRGDEKDWRGDEKDGRGDEKDERGVAEYGSVSKETADVDKKVGVRCETCFGDGTEPLDKGEGLTGAVVDAT